MKYEAYDYQKYATDYILDHKMCCLMLDMGLGKTVITLSALWQLALDRFDVSRILVIAPKRVAEDTWPKEISKWEHLTGLNYSLVLGSKDKREEALSKKAFIYIINRENVVWLTQNHKWDFDMWLDSMEKCYYFQEQIFRQECCLLILMLMTIMIAILFQCMY